MSPYTIAGTLFAALLIFRYMVLRSLNADSIVASALASLGLYAFLFSCGLGVEHFEKRAFLIPGILSFLLCISASIEYVQCWQKNSSKESAEHHKGILFVMLISCAVYLLALPVFGYYLTTILFLFSGCLLLGNRQYLKILFVSFSWCCFAFLVFEYMLQVPLPSSSLLGSS